MDRSEYQHIFSEEDPEKIYEILEEISPDPQIYKAKNKKSNELVTLKICPCDDGLANEYLQEAAILHDLNHKNILRLDGCYQKNNKLYVAQEYASFGPMNQLIESGIIPEIIIAYIIKECLMTIKYLHSEALVLHRDIKGPNIHLTMDGNVKFADFGVACQLGYRSERRSSCIGTPWWMAPEMILTARDDSDSYDYKVDIWSLGILCLELADGAPPMAHIDGMDVLYEIITRDPPELHSVEDWSYQFKSFVDSCLIKEPERRRSAEQLVEQPFITGCKGTKEDLANYLAKISPSSVSSTSTSSSSSTTSSSSSSSSSPLSSPPSQELKSSQEKSNDKDESPTSNKSIQEIVSDDIRSPRASVSEMRKPAGKGTQAYNVEGSSSSGVFSTGAIGSSGKQGKGNKSNRENSRMISGGASGSVGERGKSAEEIQLQEKLLKERLQKLGIHQKEGKRLAEELLRTQVTELKELERQHSHSQMNMNVNLTSSICDENSNGSNLNSSSSSSSSPSSSTSSISSTASNDIMSLSSSISSGSTSTVSSSTTTTTSTSSSTSSSSASPSVVPSLGGSIFTPSLMKKGTTDIKGFSPLRLIELASPRGHRRDSFEHNPSSINSNTLSINAISGFSLSSSSQKSSSPTPAHSTPPTLSTQSVPTSSSSSPSTLPSLTNSLNISSVSTIKIKLSNTEYVSFPYIPDQLMSALLQKLSKKRQLNPQEYYFKAKGLAILCDMTLQETEATEFELCVKKGIDKAEMREKLFSQFEKLNKQRVKNFRQYYQTQLGDIENSFNQQVDFLNKRGAMVHRHIQEYSTLLQDILLQQHAITREQQLKGFDLLGKQIVKDYTVYQRELKKFFKDQMASSNPLSLVMSSSSSSSSSSSGKKGSKGKEQLSFKNKEELKQYLQLDNLKFELKLKENYSNKEQQLILRQKAEICKQEEKMLQRSQKAIVATQIKIFRAQSTFMERKRTLLSELTKRETYILESMNSLISESHFTDRHYASLTHSLVTNVKEELKSVIDELKSKVQQKNEIEEEQWQIKLQVDALHKEQLIEMIEKRRKLDNEFELGVTKFRNMLMEHHQQKEKLLMKQRNMFSHLKKDPKLFEQTKEKMMIEFRDDLDRIENQLEQERFELAREIRKKEEELKKDPLYWGTTFDNRIQKEVKKESENELNESSE